MYKRRSLHATALSNAIATATSEMKFRSSTGKSFRNALLTTSGAAILGSSLMMSPAAFAQEDESVTEVVVTGSRIVRRDYEANSPIVTVDAESFDQVSNIGVEAALNQLPQFVPADTQFTNAIESNTFATPGISSLNLRGLGPNRNLVLLDGRRAQPSNALLVVDTNSVPAAAIESVEIISGGASATYGADALGGVVNFILKKNFEGFNLNTQTSTTKDGGGEETKVSALVGGNFGDGRGNVMLGVDWTTREAVYQRDRDFYSSAWTDGGTSGGLSGITYSRYAPGGNAPDQSVVDTIFGGGVGATSPFYVNPDQETVFISDGSNYTGPIGPGSDYKLYTNGNTGDTELVYVGDFAVVSTPLERYSIFGRAHYDINDNVSAFLQVNMSEMVADTTFNYAPASSNWDATIPRDGRELPAELEMLLDSRDDPNADWTLERDTDFMGPRRSSNESVVYQVMAGLNGNIGDSDWTYEAYASHGKTTLTFNGRGFPSVERWRALVAAPNFGQGFSGSYGAGFSATCTSGIPVFDDFEVSEDCINTLEPRLKNITTIEQDIMEAFVQGPLMELPAGEARIAAGVSTRKNSFGYNPDDLLDQQSITDGPAGLFASNETFGETEVKELYAEALVPVLSDIPGIQELNLEIGARYSDYNTAGEIWTYKGLVDWRLNDTLRFRGGYQLANRAPNAAELFTAPSQDIIVFPGADPCFSNTTNEWGNVPGNPNRAQVIQLCSDLINASGANNDSEWQTSSDFPDAITGPFANNFPWEVGVPQGNPQLENEEAETYTIGAVVNWQNIMVAIDYYDIVIEQAIEPSDARFIYQECLNANGTNPSYDVNNFFCQQITRNPNTGYRERVNTPFANVGTIETSGVDIQVNSFWDIGSGSLTVGGTLNYLNEYRDQVNPVSPFIDATGTLSDGGQFDYKLNINTTYMLNSLTVGARMRYLPAIDNAAAATDPSTTLQGANDYAVFDMFGNYIVTDNLTVRAGIDNLFDTQPEIVGKETGVTNAQGTTSPGFYDVLGQRFYLGIDLSF